MTPDLKTVVNDWLKKNRPLLYVDDHGNIGLLEEKGKQSKMFGSLVYGWVHSSDVRFLNPARFSGFRDLIQINAADPKFFEKLAKHLPPKL